MPVFEGGKFVRIIAALAFAVCCVLTPAEARGFKSVVTMLDEIPRVHPKYPIPSEPNQIFYIERSSNSNTVVYVANLDAKGRLDAGEPVKGYWRWYNRGGYVKPLNMIERMLAYGIKDVKHDGPNGAYSFHLAAFPERTIYVGLDANGHPEAFGKIGKDEWVRLVYVYLEVDDSGVLPDVPAMDFFGYDMATGKALHEHITRP